MSNRIAVESWPFLSKGNAQQPRKTKLLTSSTHASSNDVWSSSIISTIAVFVVTSVAWAIVLIFTLHRSLHISGPAVANWTADHHNSSFLASEVEFLTCGQSIAEAKTKGCQYDILTNHWLPEPCADEFSIMEYQSDGSWFPYADESRTELLAMEELGDLPYYYTSMRDHIVHCAMLWRRQFRALSEGWKYVDQITVDAHHTMHCANFLMEKAELQVYREQAIKVVVGKSGCHVREV